MMEGFETNLFELHYTTLRQFLKKNKSISKLEAQGNYYFFKKILNFFFKENKSKIESKRHSKYILKDVFQNCLSRSFKAEIEGER